ncbi:hypothetical protein [Streptomyces sp. NPDC029674]
MPKDIYHCAQCEQHTHLHRGGANLPCKWCEEHAKTIPFWR